MLHSQEVAPAGFEPKPSDSNALPFRVHGAVSYRRSALSPISVVTTPGPQSQRVIVWMESGGQSGGRGSTQALAFVSVYVCGGGFDDGELSRELVFGLLNNHNLY